MAPQVTVTVVVDRYSDKGTTVAVGRTTTADGVTAVEAVEGPPVPALLVAVTVNVYGVPFVNPVTQHDRPAEVHVLPPGDDVTV